MNFPRVARDVLIVSALLFIGGFVIGVAGGSMNDATGRIAMGISNIIFSVLGFCIVGAMKKKDRFKHLTVVALGLWLFSLTNIFFFNVSFMSWIFSIFIIFISMGVGGALSFLFAKNPQPLQQD